MATRRSSCEQALSYKPAGGSSKQGGTSEAAATRPEQKESDGASEGDGDSDDDEGVFLRRGGRRQGTPVADETKYTTLHGRLVKGGGTKYTVSGYSIPYTICTGVSSTEGAVLSVEYKV